jgi:hypothetical protein
MLLLSILSAEIEAVRFCSSLVLDTANRYNRIQYNSTNVTRYVVHGMCLQWLPYEVLRLHLTVM